MSDYTAYMLAEMLKGTFKPYGSAYGHGVSGVNMGAKTGTGTYGAETYSQYNLPDNAAKDVGLTALHLNTLCQCGWASVKLNNMVKTHLWDIANKNIHSSYMKM